MKERQVKQIKMFRINTYEEPLTSFEDEVNKWLTEHSATICNIAIKTPTDTVIVIIIEYELSMTEDDLGFYEED
jgi:hypothetical protein